MWKDSGPLPRGARRRVECCWCDERSDERADERADERSDEHTDENANLISVKGADHGSTDEKSYLGSVDGTNHGCSDVRTDRSADARADSTDP